MSRRGIYKRSPETIKKQSEHRREKSWNWKGGCMRVRMQMVLERDDYTCKNCGHREPEIMQVNHIIPYSENKKLRMDMKNMETLCPNCHVRKTKEWYRSKRLKGRPARKIYAK